MKFSVVVVVVLLAAQLAVSSRLKKRIDKRTVGVLYANESKHRAHIHGNSKCPCIGIDSIEGYTEAKIGDGKFHNYPADLGAHCAAWDNGEHPTSCLDGQKPGKDNGWCADSWCYVDPCNCDIPVAPKPATYAPEATHRGKPIYYSYATCGATDKWSAANNKKSCLFQKSEAECNELDDCSWTGEVCMGEKARTICGYEGDDDCKCIGIDGAPGVTKVAISKDETADYPSDTGASCRSWDKARHPDCEGEDPPSWCHDEWCYVDPCKCMLKVPPKVSSYIPEANYQGKSVYFSYATCGSVDKWTKKENKKACVNQKNKFACDTQDKCAWTGKECLGKDLVKTCGWDKKPKSGAEALRPLFAFLPLLMLLA